MHALGGEGGHVPAPTRPPASVKGSSEVQPGCPSLPVPFHSAILQGWGRPSCPRTWGVWPSVPWALAQQKSRAACGHLPCLGLWAAPRTRFICPTVHPNYLGRLHNSRGLDPPYPATSYKDSLGGPLGGLGEARRLPGRGFMGGGRDSRAQEANDLTWKTGWK